MKKFPHNYKDSYGSLSSLVKVVARHIIDESGIKGGKSNPRILIMAGISGSGKTEFLGSYFKLYPEIAEEFLRIDLDEIVKIFDTYTPETDYKFRKAGSAIVNEIFGIAIKNGYNLALDGTFAHDKAVSNIERVIRRNYRIQLFVMDESVEQAKKYTEIREAVERRKIDTSDFDSIVDRVRKNLQKLPNSKNLRISVVEKDLSTRSYKLSTLESYKIDNLYKK